MAGIVEDNNVRRELLYSAFFPNKLFIIRKKLKKKRKKCDFEESEAEDALTISEFFFREQRLFKMFIYEFVENFTGYPNMLLLFPKCKIIIIKYRKYHV